MDLDTEGIDGVPGDAVEDLPIHEAICEIVTIRERQKRDEERRKELERHVLQYLEQHGADQLRTKAGPTAYLGEPTLVAYWNTFPDDHPLWDWIEKESGLKRSYNAVSLNTWLKRRLAEGLEAHEALAGKYEIKPRLNVRANGYEKD